MFFEEKMYGIKCDNCKLQFENAGFCYMNDKLGMEDSAQDSGWQTIVDKDNKHYCPDCWSWDDDDEFSINESRHKP